ncbi:MAG: hypothetical protein AAF483_30775 [Planctomycetota bacterium]
MTTPTEIDKCAFSTVKPKTAEELRSRLYEGELFLFAATVESLEFVNAAQAAIEESFQAIGDARRAQQKMDAAEFFAKAGELRKKIYKESSFHKLIAKLVSSIGFADERTGVDPARLRVVMPGGHKNPAAAAMYYGHRDTWYANPQSMLTWWIPMHEVDESNSFCFFPEHFGRAVSNDSEIFNFEDWVSKDEKKLIGWQDKSTGLTAKYPQLLEEPDGLQVPVECQKGDIVLFAGQHLHRTYRHNCELTRFSLDFRTVDFVDQEEGREAKNTDNRSTGSWNKKFLPLQDNNLRVIQ